VTVPTFLAVPTLSQRSVTPVGTAQLIDDSSGNCHSSQRPNLSSLRLYRIYKYIEECGPPLGRDVETDCADSESRSEVSSVSTSSAVPTTVALTAPISTLTLCGEAV
jgi:hypothetical protein